MQTEMMLRLLLRDNNSPSGYKIVGYERKRVEEKGGRIVPRSRTVGDRIMWSLLGHVDCDAFEYGVKVNGEWYFEGDQFYVYRLYREDTIKTLKFGLNKEGGWYGWYWEFHDYGGCNDIFDCNKSPGKLIGNIHEEGVVKNG